MGKQDTKSLTCYCRESPEASVLLIGSLSDFFLIALLSGLSVSVLGAPWAPWPGLLHAACVLAGCALLYALTRFRWQLWELVVREMAPENEDEGEEQADEEDGE